MAEIYGADAWGRRYGEEPNDTWRYALGGQTPQDIALGVQRCQRDDSGRMPTVGQFHALCRRYQAGTFAGHTPALPPGGPKAFLERAGRQAASETARVHIALCRKIHGNGDLDEAEQALLTKALRSTGHEETYRALRGDKA